MRLISAIVLIAVMIIGAYTSITRSYKCELKVYRDLHATEDGKYYQITDIESPSKTGGKQFLSVNELSVSITSNPKSQETVVELRPNGKIRMIEVPNTSSGPKALGSIVTVTGDRSWYFINDYEATKHLLGIKNEKP